MPDTSLGRDVLALAQRGDLGGMSLRVPGPQRRRALDQEPARAAGARPGRGVHGRRLARLQRHRGARPQVGAAWSPRRRPALPRDGLMGVCGASPHGSTRRRDAVVLQPRRRARRAAVRRRGLPGRAYRLARAPPRTCPPCWPASAPSSSALASPPAVGIPAHRARAARSTRPHPLMRLTRQGANALSVLARLRRVAGRRARCLSGNGLAEVVTDARGALVELRPVPWSWAAVQMLPNGRLVFDVSEQQGVFGTAARGRRRLLAGRGPPAHRSERRRRSRRFPAAPGRQRDRRRAVAAGLRRQRAVAGHLSQRRHHGRGQARRPGSVSTSASEFRSFAGTEQRRARRSCSTRA